MVTRTRRVATPAVTPAAEQNTARQALYQQFMSVPHRDYNDMVVALRGAMASDPDFISRACVYLLSGGTAIRDQQDVAVIALLQANPDFHEFRNAGRALLLGSNVYKITVDGIAAKAKGLPPFRILRVLDFIAKNTFKIPRLRKTITRDYLTYLQADQRRLDSVALYNRHGLVRLYEREHVKPNVLAQAMLFDEQPPIGTQLWAVRSIAHHRDDPVEAAKLIIKHKIPYRIAATIAAKTHPAVGMALVEVMSPTEAINSRKWVEASGLLSTPEVRKAYLAKIGTVRGGVASVMHRVSAQGADEEVQAIIDVAVQKAVDKGQRIASNVLILVDRSGSMSQSIEVAKEFGFRIAPSVDGELRVVAFNEYASVIKVADKNSLKGWQEAFKTITDNGGTSVEVGFRKGVENFTPHVIVVITDGGENRGDFASALQAWTRETGITPRVGVIRVAGEPDQLSGRIEAKKMWEFDRVEFDGDYYVFDQMTSFFGGPPAKSFVERIMDTSLPVIEGLA